MSKFIGAVSRGLSAANVVDQYKREIEEVLIAVDAAVRNATNHKVSLVLTDDIATEKDEFLRSIAVFINKERTQFLALKSLTSPTIAVQKIAVWKQSSNGYPCNIQVDHQEFLCTDKASLEDVLADILSTSSFGQSLLKIKNAKPKVIPEHIATSGISRGVLAQKSQVPRKISLESNSINVRQKKTPVINVKTAKSIVASAKKATTVTKKTVKKK